MKELWDIYDSNRKKQEAQPREMFTNCKVENTILLSQGPL